MTPTVLLVKTSSLGDVLHTLPAVNDLKRQRPDSTLWWVVEEGLAEVASWSPAVDRIIPVALRRWRAHLFEPATFREARSFIHDLRKIPFFRIVDAQGLLKSALIARLAQGPRWGPAGAWIRERLALPFYDRTLPLPEEWHVVQRLRALMAAACDYPLPDEPPEFGLDPERLPTIEKPERPFVLLLTGAAWTSKVYPEPYWGALIAVLLAQKDLELRLPWGNALERARVERLAKSNPDRIRVCPAMGLGALAAWMVAAQGVVGQDSGLAHISSALDRPTVTLFGATNPDYSGVPGKRSRHLRADWPCAPCMKRRCFQPDEGPVHPPCFQSIDPGMAASALLTLMDA